MSQAGELSRERAKQGFWPREHGAYGQLGLPLVAALAMGRPTTSSLLFAASAIAGFIAHEPLLVWLGRRGPRARREHGARAGRYGALIGGAGAAMGIAAILLGPPTIARSTLLPLGLALVVFAFVWQDRERTTLGELVAGAALSSAALPVALSGGTSVALGLTACLAWALAFGCGTAAVRAVVRFAKTGQRGFSLVAVVVGGSLLVGAAATRAPIALSAAPMLLVSWVLLSMPPKPKHLRRVGWALVASSTAVATLLVILARR